MQQGGECAIGGFKTFGDATRVLLHHTHTGKVVELDGLPKSAKYVAVEVTDERQRLAVSNSFKE